MACLASVEYTSLFEPLSPWLKASQKTGFACWNSEERFLGRCSRVKGGLWICWSPDEVELG
jgi:hypothetical protein